jgi:peroxiredoxin
MILIKLLKSLFFYGKSLFNLNRVKRSGDRLFLINVVCCLILVSSLFVCQTPAVAGLNDDRYDGNIYILYGGNGSLVPPRMDLPTSLKRNKPAILVFYVDDSSDCKQFSIVVTRLQEFYGKAASIIPVSVDSFIDKDRYTPEEPAYYYSGVVPETVVLDEAGKVAYDGKGQVPYEEVDDALREVFDLLPRSESQVLKRRSFNEYNSGMTQD